MSYSVQSTNIFDLLSEDNAENLGTSEKVKQPSKTGSTQQPKPSGNVPTKTQHVTKPPPKPEQRKSVNDSSSKGGFETRGAKPERKERESQDFNTGGERKPSTFQQRQPREPREPRGGFSSDTERKDKDAGFSTGNKRVYDRRSGTGRGKEGKKQGSGKGNWGKDGEGFEEQPQVSGEESNKTVSEPEKEKEEVKQYQEPEKDPETLEREKKEQEDYEKEAKMMLYDEYVQQQQNKVVNVALPEARKPNEGADRSEAKKWASYTQLKREDESDEEESTETGGKQKEKKSNKKVVPVDQVFVVQQKRRERPERDRPERSERSERSDRPDRQDRRKTSKPFGRGGGGRGRGFNTSSQSSSQSEPNFDESSFPSLATKA